MSSQVLSYRLFLIQRNLKRLINDGNIKINGIVILILPDYPRFALFFYILFIIHILNLIVGSTVCRNIRVFIALLYNKEQTI